MENLPIPELEIEVFSSDQERIQHGDILIRQKVSEAGEFYCDGIRTMREVLGQVGNELGQPEMYIDGRNYNLGLWGSPDMVNRLNETQLRGLALYLLLLKPREDNFTLVLDQVWSNYLLDGTETPVDSALLELDSGDENTKEIIRKGVELQEDYKRLSGLYLLLVNAFVTCLRINQEIYLE